MNKREMDQMESELRERLMKERWRLTAEQEAGELPYASNKEIADEKIGKWLSAALEDPTTCGAMKDDINEWFRAVEEERLRSKKKYIHDELWEAVKMEMFKASSALEGIEYDNQEVPCKTHPDAPHGFDRNASLSMDRYVCECEYWEPDWEPGELEVEGWDITKPAELKQLLQEMCDRMDRIEHGDSLS